MTILVSGSSRDEPLWQSCTGWRYGSVMAKPLNIRIVDNIEVEAVSDGNQTQRVALNKGAVYKCMIMQAGVTECVIEGSDTIEYIETAIMDLGEGYIINIPYASFEFI